MTAPQEFERFAKLREHAERIGNEMTVLIAQAHIEGVRDGVDLVATWLDNMADVLRVGLPLAVDSSSQTQMLAQIASLEWIRDQVRLLAHQIPDPEVNTANG